MRDNGALMKVKIDTRKMGQPVTAGVCVHLTLDKYEHTSYVSNVNVNVGIFSLTKRV